MNLVKVCVSGLIKDNNGKVLIVKRSPHDSFPDKWELPGGMVEFNEEPSVSLTREIEEETGVLCKVAEPYKVSSSLTRDNDQLIRIFYKCNPIGSLDQINLSHEHTEHKWVSETELENLYK